jgi:hypothetical protein
MPFPFFSRSGQNQQQLRAEIHRLEDPALVQQCFDEYWEDFGINDEIDAVVRLETCKALCEAQRQLVEETTLTMEGRGRLRSFLLNERIRRT